jgi:hypothetical protein
MVFYQLDPEVLVKRVQIALAADQRGLRLIYRLPFRSNWRVTSIAEQFQLITKLH